MHFVPIDPENRKMHKVEDFWVIEKNLAAAMLIAKFLFYPSFYWANILIYYYYTLDKITI